MTQGCRNRPDRPDLVWPRFWSLIYIFSWNLWIVANGDISRSGLKKSCSGTPVTCILLAYDLHKTSLKLACDMDMTCIWLACDLHMTCKSLAYDLALEFFFHLAENVWNGWTDTIWMNLFWRLPPLFDVEFYLSIRAYRCTFHWFDRTLRSWQVTLPNLT